MQSPDYFKGGSDNKVDTLSKADQESIDLILKDIEEKCYSRLKSTCEQYFSND